MAAIERIEVTGQHDNGETTLATTLAIKLHDLVRSYGFDSQEQFGDKSLPVRRAGPYFYGVDRQGNRHMFRLVSPYSYAISETALVTTTGEEAGEDDIPRRSFKVIRLEHGWLAPELDEGVIEEKEFHWTPYVAAIINHDEPDTPEFYNTQNGKELDFQDVMDVQSIVDLMGEAFREDMYRVGLEKYDDDDVEVAYGLSEEEEEPVRYEPFRRTLTE